MRWRSPHSNRIPAVKLQILNGRSPGRACWLTSSWDLTLTCRYRSMMASCTWVEELLWLRLLLRCWVWFDWSPLLPLLWCFDDEEVGWFPCATEPLFPVALAPLGCEEFLACLSRDRECSRFYSRSSCIYVVIQTNKTSLLFKFDFKFGQSLAPLFETLLPLI